MQINAELSRAIFDSAAQGIVIVEASGKVLVANGAMERLFGYDAGELEGLPIEALVPMPLREAHVGYRQSYFDHPRQRPMGHTMKLDGVRRGGEVFPIEVSLGFDHTPQGMVAIAFVADISIRRQLEKNQERDAARLRTLTAQLLTAQQDERRLIARELHDGPTQELAALGIELGLLRREVSEPLTVKLAELQKTAAELSEQVRQMAHTYHPGVLEHSGLVAALQSHCRDVQRQSGMAVSFTSREINAEIPRDVALTLYRISQEALRNVARHANANQVDVLLAGVERDGGGRALRLSVVDNGRGFAVEEVREASGLGLLSIEERARLMQGVLTISSMPGEGTRLTVEVPLMETHA